MTITASFIFSPVSVVENNMLWKTTGNFRYRWNKYKDNDRKHSRKDARTVCNNICLDILAAWDTVVSLTIFQ